MNRALWNKTIREARLLWLSCAAVLFAFGWVRVWLVSLLDTSRFKAILDQLPDYLQRLSPVPLEQLATYPGRISFTFSEPIAVVLVAVWAFSRGSDTVSGELGRGTMEILLAQPISRLQILWTKTCVTMAGLALLVLVVWTGILTGIATTAVEFAPEPPVLKVPGFGWSIPLGWDQGEPQIVPMSDLVTGPIFAPAVLNLFSLGFFLTSVATLLSACDRYRWRTIGIAVGFYITELFVKVVAVAAEGWHWLRNCTFFTAFEPEKFVLAGVHAPKNGWAWTVLDSEGRIADLGPLGYDAVLIGLGLGALLLATLVFCRRDLPAPL